MVANPTLQLTKICEFVQVPISPNYLIATTSCVVREPHRRRLEFDWTLKQKQDVASLIEKYDFFSGYEY